MDTPLFDINKKDWGRSRHNSLADSMGVWKMTKKVVMASILW
jgi:hypothetical protein